MQHVNIFRAARPLGSGLRPHRLRVVAALAVLAFTTSPTARAQGVGIGTGASAPDPSAVLEVQSTTQGLLLPRLTAAQRAAIVAPVAGLTVYQTDGTPGLYYYNGKGWLNATTGFIPASDGTAYTAPLKGVVTTLAGLAGTSGSADGTGSAARFFNPGAVALDATGNLYVSDVANFVIRKVTPAGVVTTVAGLAGTSGSTDGTGSAARFRSPQGLAFDASGNLFIGEAVNHIIRKMTPAGVVTTFAGQVGVAGSANGTGTAATFNQPTALAFDATGTLYVGELNNYTIRKITPAGVVTTFVGTAGTSGSADGTGAAARFTSIRALAFDASGTLFVADGTVVRRVSPAGVVTTFTGQAGTTTSTDGTGTAATFSTIYGLSTDAAGQVYVGELNSVIRKITPVGVVTTVAGLAGTSGSADGTGAAARFSTPYRLAVDANGVLYVPDYNNYTIRVIR